MDMIINVSNLTHLKKQLFTLKSNSKDGLLLQIYYSVKVNEKHCNVRFVSTCFNNHGQILAASTLSGHIYVVDFTQNKFWFLINLTSCSVLRFSSQNEDCIIAGVTSGLLNIINIHTGEIIGKLEGHSYPAVSISFSNDFLCVTSSTSEAIVWDLRSNSKIQILSLSSDTFLKQVYFIPVSNNILACFNDDSIHIWKYGTFQYLKQIKPASWNKFYIKHITFTKNGRIMALAGNSPNIAVFSLDTWNLEKTVSLPEQIKAVKKLIFISQPFDGGANRVLSILSSNGIIYFYDIQVDVFLNKLALELEILKYEMSADGKYLACVITCGRVNIYLLTHYISFNLNVKLNQQTKSKHKHKLRLKKSMEFLNNVKQEITDMLDMQKLHTVLKEFGEYPEVHRLKIWSILLQLPNNKELYNTVINFNCDVSLNDFEQKYPLQNKVALKNLKRLMVNLVNWCPFFGEVEYIPLFVFPFVKIFKNEPVACFEAVCTIIVNWCQYWFEYYPLPPINVLAMVENILSEHNPALLNHFTKCNITPKIYAWPILQTGFSEVLRARDLLILWDNILSNEPSYLVFAVVVFNLINSQYLLRMHHLKEIEQFYHSQNLLDIKKLVTKTYYLLNSTSKKNHPRQYFNYFRPIEIGVYPQFLDYPQAMLHYQSDLKNLRKSKYGIMHDEQKIISQNSKLSKIEEVKRNVEENVRMKELDNIYKTKLEDEIAIVDHQRKRLEELKKALEDQELNIQKAVYKSLTYKKANKVNSMKLNSPKYIWESTIALNLKAMEKLIKRIENELRNQEMNLENKDVDVQQFAAETVELELKLLKQLQLLNYLKQQPNILAQQDDFELLKYTMKKIEDGYQARSPSPIS